MALKLDDVRIQTPCGMIVCGPTMSGKSEFVFKLIRHQENMFNHVFDRVLYCYGEWQPIFDKLQQEVPQLRFIKGLQPLLEDENFFTNKERSLLILDDLAVEACNDPRASQLFTKGIHHRNLSVIFILQNLYKQGKSMRDITLNAQYFVLFKNVRDINQISTLSRQMGLSHLVDAYRKVTAQAFQPLIIDMRPNTKDHLRLRSHMLPDDEFVHIYTKKDTALPCPKG